MAHDQYHFGGAGTEDNPDYWNLETPEGQAAYNAYMASVASSTTTGTIKKPLPEGATYNLYVSIHRNYANLSNEDKLKFNKLQGFYDLVYNRTFLPNDTFWVMKDGSESEISAAEAAMIVSYVMAQKVLTGEIPDPSQETLQDEVEKEDSPNTLRIRIMQQKSEDGVTWTEPVDVNVQLTEAQYDFLIQSPEWNKLADIDETKRIITTHTNNWWDLRVLMQDAAAMGLEGTFDPGDESDPNFDPAAAGGDAEGMLAAIFAKANGEVQSFNPYNPRNDGLPPIPAEDA